MPDLDRLHLGGATGLAARLHHGGDLVVDPHEGKRARGLAAAGELLAVRAKRREVGAGAAAELEQHGLAAGELHDVFHVVVHVLDEAGRALGELVRVLWLDDGARLRIPAPVALGAGDAVLVVEADVEPDGRVEGAMLVKAEPRQVAVKTLAIFGGSEVAVLETPVGDRADDAVDQLADAVLALIGADFAVEVLAADDIGGKLRPERGNLAVGLLEQHFPVFAFDGGAADFPVDGVEDVGDVDRTELGVDLQPAVKALGGATGRTSGTGLGTRSKRSVGHRHNQTSCFGSFRRASYHCVQKYTPLQSIGIVAGRP